MATVYFKIFGRVQGVGFRYFTLRSADRLGITGWVRNVGDGTVEVLGCGTHSTLLSFKKELIRGPSFSQVTEIQRLDHEDEGIFDQFTIRY